MRTALHPSLAKIRLGKRICYAVAGPDGLRDLTARNLITPRNIHQHLGTLELTRLIEEEATKACDLNYEAASFEPFFPNPRKIFCIGVNYPNRNEEYKDNQDAPPNPSVFIRYKESFVGHRQLLLKPPESDQFDYEGEFVIIIGKAGRRIPQAAASQHIAGLTLGNEGTMRDWVRHAKFNVTQGKNFTKSGSIGPWLVPSDYIPDFDKLEITTKVNGDIRQHDTTNGLMFSFAKIVSYLSTFTTLRSGDIIFSGTPTGAGARMSPPQYLSAGDEIDVSSPSIGTLSNLVALEAE